MSVRLYIGNLPKELQRQDFEAVFAEESEGVVSVKLIADRKTGKCRGFGFVTVRNDEIADSLVEKYNGYSLQDIELKVEKALPRAKGKEEGEAPDTAATPNARRNNQNGGGAKKGRKSNAGGADDASNPDTIQPDPRWAQDLEKLKQLLAAQTAAS
jgi:RNA recognition motif-containing protein